ncbi:hypothetical protein Sjap_011750 [Stephania japonica]|uniref:VOC domain-containing protein n=1 Tax=Stephania japonica TaxID=461633 RepID=A0AAP0JC39_9MAGN
MKKRERARVSTVSSSDRRQGANNHAIVEDGSRMVGYKETAPLIRREHTHLNAYRGVCRANEQSMAAAAASIVCSSFKSPSLQSNEVNHVGLAISQPIIPSKKNLRRFARKDNKETSISLKTKAKMSTEGDLLVKESPTSVDAHEGLEINEARPHDKLPYRGAWLWVGSEMIHLMELTNPDPLTGRPEHGGRDRHACIAIRDVSKLKLVLDKAGIPYTLSRSGRPAIFTRDPDANALEFTQVDG